MIGFLKDRNFLKYTRDDMEIDEVVIEGKKINTVNYIESVDNKSRRPQRACAMITLLTIKISVLKSNSIGKLNIAILRRRG